MSPNLNDLDFKHAKAASSLGVAVARADGTVDVRVMNNGRCRTMPEGVSRIYKGKDLRCDV